VHRRFEVRGEERDIIVVDDYGHHPEEIRVTLRAAREGFPRRLVVAFQPHRYTRTRDLFEEFLSVFDDADVLLMTEIYPAGEDRIDGVTGESLYQALKRRGHLDVRFVPSREHLAEALLEAARPGDLVLTLGAGDVHRCADELLGLLRAGAAVPAVH
jgi:UDP-N-acetylmuramate--alanine ligase